MKRLAHLIAVAVFLSFSSAASLSQTNCQWVLKENGSPVIIDTKGIGFHFTDPTKGDYVTFDLKGDGSYKKYSWPKHDSGNAWLVLDRDDDGMIKDGTELFGNLTPHSDGGVPNHPNPNGFLALDWYDQPQQGGDGNLILDAKDAIWPKLKLWIDDHCYKTPDAPCHSLPQELHTLESEGVYSISMVWGVVNEIPAGTPTPKVPTYGPLAGLTDVIGNQYKYYTLLNPDAEKTPRDGKGQVCCDLHMKSHDGRWAIDVWPEYIQ